MYFPKIFSYLYYDIIPFPAYLWKLDIVIQINIKNNGLICSNFAEQKLYLKLDSLDIFQSPFARTCEWILRIHHILLVNHTWQCFHQGRREGFMVGGGQTENLPPEKKLPPEIFFAPKVSGKFLFIIVKISTHWIWKKVLWN